jgi:hypothetical protein
VNLIAGVVIDIRVGEAMEIVGLSVVDNVTVTVDFSVKVVAGVVAVTEL